MVNENSKKVVQLSSMTNDEYALWHKDAVTHYADENVQAGRWRAESAQATAQRTFSSLLPLEDATPDHHFYAVRDIKSQQRVGFLWLFINRDGPGVQAYIYNIVIDEGCRGQGYGAATLIAVEDAARKLGATSMGLNVFAHNVTAKRLYQRHGYADVTSAMSKPIG